MKRFISYLYEYGQGRKIQNIGFAKAELKDSEGLMQIHGKGIHPPRQGKVKVYLCYEQEGKCVGIFQGELEHTEPAVDYRLLYTTADTGGQEIYDRIAGIILKTDDHQTYAALWGEKLLDPEQMVDQKEVLGKKDIFPEPEREMGQDEKEEVIQQKEAADNEEIEPPEIMESEKMPEEMPVQTVIEEVSEIKAEETSEPENPQEEKKLKEDKEAKEKILREMECGEMVKEPQVLYEKITREDIARLPRCEWGNANNTFLLHGYRNYHHLLLIDDRGQLWLGVPGVYHEREQIAASSCGFPRFWRIPVDQLGLSKEERNDGEDFGYWCRKVRRRRP